MVDFKHFHFTGKRNWTTGCVTTYPPQHPTPDLLRIIPARRIVVGQDATDAANQ